MTEDAAEREYRLRSFENWWQEAEHDSGHLLGQREGFMAGFDAARTFYNEWTPDAMPASKW